MGNEQFKETFKEEAQDYLNSIEENLLGLEKNKSDSKAIDNIFRGLHSLKGGAAMFGFYHVNDLSHQMENLYERLRDKEFTLNDSLISLTFRAIDIFKALLKTDDRLEDEQAYQQILEQIKASLTQTEGAQGEAEKAKDSASKSGITTYYIYFNPSQDILNNGTNPLYLMDELMNLGEGEVFVKTYDLPSLHQTDPTQCYLAWEVLLVTEATEEEISEVFLFVEEESEITIESLAKENLLNRESVKHELQQVKDDRRMSVEKLKQAAGDNAPLDSSAAEEPSSGEQSIKVASSKIDELINAVGELVTYQSQLSMLATHLQNPQLEEFREGMEKLTARIRDVAFDVSLVPLKSMLLQFRRLVRDLSHEQGKEIVFYTEGEDTQLDKTIIENLHEPILHILRNSIRHGIESEQERLGAGKNAYGELWLKAYYSGPEVHIEISDDGRGFDFEKIKEQAVKQGLLGPDEEVSRDKLLEMTFKSGFTTTYSADGVSGRGVGMDVIRSTLSQINGDVRVHSEKGKGSVITLIIPLTLSIVDGLMVSVHDQHFILPLTVIDRIETIEASQLESFNRIVSLKGESIPCIPMFFDPGLDDHEQAGYPVVVVNYDDTKYGFIVHKVLGNSQVVLKPLGKYLESLNVFSGGCLLGDGTIAFVMDIRKFIEEKKEKSETR
ncbi:MAG: chemotaxis protein CheA [Bacteroidales bacterium]|nr:chemotaxis protein CheA [Bacteroidales bacterium]